MTLWGAAQITFIILRGRLQDVFRLRSKKKRPISYRAFFMRHKSAIKASLRLQAPLRSQSSAVLPE